MRLFVALDLPDTIVTRLEALITLLRPSARVQWSPVENLHITTKFIGEWPDARLDEVKSALSGVSAGGPLEIRVEGIGWFPNAHSPRVFWAGIQASEALQNLAHATDRAVAELGVAAETRPFHPHLTLARIKNAVDLSPLRQAIDGLEPVDFGAFTVRSQFLYQSERVYTKLAEFPLS